MNAYRKSTSPSFILTAIILALVLSGCQRFQAISATPTPVPLFNPSSGLTEIKCPFSSAQELEVTCGTLEVPEDYAEIDGDTIELLTVIVHSTGEIRTRDPLLLLGFDSGVSMLDTTGYIGRQLGPMIEARDLVFYDYRGMGHSGRALECEGYLDTYFQTLLENLTPDQEIQAFEPVLKTCREKMTNAETNPLVYTTTEMAADLNGLRLALGYEQFNIITGGFGSNLAFTMIRDYPQAVRSLAIINFDIPLTYLSQEMFAITLQGSIDLLFNRCLSDEECRLAYPDIRNQFYQAVDQLNYSPVDMPSFIPNQTGMIDIKFNGSDLINLIKSLMATRQSIAGIPKMIDEASRGKAVNLSDELYQYRLNIPEEFYAGLQITNICSQIHENFWQLTPASRDVQDVVMRAVQSEWGIFSQLCPIWTGKNLVQPAGAKINSDIPTLVLQGEFQPSLSPEITADLLSEMSKATHVVVPNMGNDVFGGESCAGLLLFTWLGDPNQDLDYSCVNNIEPIEFEKPQN